MATVETLEERIAALEAEMRSVKAQINGTRYGVTGKTNPQLIAEMFGVFADEPMFDRMVRRMEEERERERREAEQEADAESGAE
jgi:hypothetical protein